MANPTDINGVIMSNSVIKTIADRQMQVIKNATDMLDSLRNVCPHEHTHLGKYSWRVGVIQDAEMCDYCGKMVRLPE